MASLLKNKQIVVAGHDPVHGGATFIVWLLDQGASVTVAGMRDTAESIHLRRRVDEQLKRSAPDGRAYEHAIARLTWTRRRRTDVADVYQLFLSGWPRKVAGITGAIGKTTTSLWAAHLIGDAVAVGHSPDRPLMSGLGSRARVAVLELDSTCTATSPRFVRFSTEQFAEYDEHGSIRRALDDGNFSAQWGAHNVANALVAFHVARTLGVPHATIVKRLASLPTIPYRQEVVHTDAKLTIVNDATAATPEAGIAALRRWGGPTTMLIAGGEVPSDDYTLWAKQLSESIRKSNVMFLTGDASRSMRTALRRYGFTVPAYGTLTAAWAAALIRARTYVSSTILFSPAAGSANGSLGYERGRELNDLARR